VKDKRCLEKYMEPSKGSVVVAIIKSFGSGTRLLYTTILAMGLPKMSLNCYLCFPQNWLPIPSSSHSESNITQSHWFYLSVKSLPCPETKNQRKTCLHGGQQHEAPAQTSEHHRWLAKYFSLCQTCFCLVLKALHILSEI
jgi:hypothetical protein